MFEFAVFLYTTLYGLIASVIPVLLLLWLLRIVIRSCKKTYRTARY